MHANNLQPHAGIFGANGWVMMFLLFLLMRMKMFDNADDVVDNADDDDDDDGNNDDDFLSYFRFVLSIISLIFHN